MWARAQGHEAVPTQAQYMICHRSRVPPYQQKKANLCEKVAAGVGGAEVLLQAAEAGAHQDGERGARRRSRRFSTS